MLDAERWFASLALCLSDYADDRLLRYCGGKLQSFSYSTYPTSNLFKLKRLKRRELQLYNSEFP